jgi:Icc-related predicted phosphoesterase
MPLFARNYHEEFRRILNLVSKVNVDIIQIGGDVNIVNSISILGIFNKCFHVSPKNVENQLYFENIFFISPLIYSKVIPQTANLQLYLFFDNSYIDQIDTENKIVFCDTY